MGQLNFGSEVGLSTFEVRSEMEPLLTTTIEIFPAKLDYKEDYRQLLNEVNDEIYNLAYHFLRKTHLGATIKVDGCQRCRSSTGYLPIILTHFLKRSLELRHSLITTCKKRTSGNAPIK
ncbi:DUF2357 domain-containing protein [Bacillus sp. JCM 19041]|uniref:DUF2357 domain-containing protein n=1 Tax=Bacillus sp. JCM 19041 TaxID=1460637 RepID=UPI0009EBA85C